MANLEQYLAGGVAMADPLLAAGMAPESVKRDRTFSSAWGFDDGERVIATVWMDDIQDPSGIPKWSQTDPSLRDDLVGARRGRALDLYRMLRSRDGGTVRVVLQRKRADKTKWKSGVADRRGLDPEPWFVSVEGSTVLLQRGQPMGRRDVTVSGAPMPSRPPGQAMRETRPEQAGFRQRVAAKSGNRCALTGAPSQVCEAAHFPWANWRTDNAPWHGALLRCDLHAALDANLLAIERTGVVVVSEYLASCSPEYAQLHGRLITVGEPDDSGD